MAQPLTLPPSPVLSPFASNTNQASDLYNKWFASLRAYILRPVPGPFADDAAAAAAGINIGHAYYLASGAVVVRLT